MAGSKSATEGLRRVFDGKGNEFNVMSPITKVRLTEGGTRVRPYPYYLIYLSWEYEENKECLSGEPPTWRDSLTG